MALTLIMGEKNYSSWSLRGWLALKHAGLDFAEKIIPMDTDEFKETISTYSPSRTVPALQHDDLTVWDSLAIIDYTATHLSPDTYFWPKDAAAYGLARSLASEMHSSFAVIRQNLPMNIRADFRHIPITPALQAAADVIMDRWAMAQPYSDGGPFLFGSFGAVDMLFAPVVMRFNTYGVAMNDMAKTYSAAVINHPLMQQWITDARVEKRKMDSDNIGSLKQIGP